MTAIGTILLLIGIILKIRKSNYAQAYYILGFTAFTAYFLIRGNLVGSCICILCVILSALPPSRTVIQAEPEMHQQDPSDMTFQEFVDFAKKHNQSGHWETEKKISKKLSKKPRFYGFFFLRSKNATKSQKKSWFYKTKKQYILCIYL